jgi:flagellar assembly protein FliH
MASDANIIAQFNMIDVEAHIKDSKKQAVDDAEQLFDAAKERSRKILDEALVKRDTLFSESRDEGHKEGFEEGVGQGLQKGEDQFIEDKRTELATSADNLKVILDQLPASLQRGKEMLSEEFENHFLSLVMEVASMALQKELNEDNFDIKDLLKGMMQQVFNHHRVLLEVHPDNVSALEGFLPELKKQFSEIEEISILGVEMDIHKITVRTEQGEIQASPQISLERLKKEWNL